MSDRLNGKIALVTGASQGIGKGIVDRFLAEGATVVASDINIDGAAGELQQGDSDALWMTHLDVGDSAQANATVNAIVEKFGQIDICVNNAGLIHADDFLDISEENFNKVMRVNLSGTFLVGQAAARAMVKSGVNGAIINMSSINAVLAHANQIPYVCSKGGVNQLTKAMALSLATKGVRVNAIGPGSIATEMLATITTDEAARNKVMSRTPMGRLGTVDEIASTAVFLASEDASYVTGQTIYVDGGRLPLAYTVPVN